MKVAEPRWFRDLCHDEMVNKLEKYQTVIEAACKVVTKNLCGSEEEFDKALQELEEATAHLDLDSESPLPKNEIKSLLSEWEPTLSLRWLDIDGVRSLQQLWRKRISDLNYEESWKKIENVKIDDLRVRQ